MPHGSATPRRRAYIRAVTTFLEAKPDCFYLVQSKPGGGKSFVTARGWEDLAEAIALYEEMGKPISRDLIGQFLRDDDIADSFSVYYNLFDKYRSDYQIMSILAGEAGLDIINRARGAEFDERVALLGLMLDAVSTSCAHALEQEEVVIELRDILRDAKPRLLEGAAVDDTVGVVISAREQSLARQGCFRHCQAELRAQGGSRHRQAQTPRGAVQTCGYGGWRGCLRDHQRCVPR